MQRIGRRAGFRVVGGGDLDSSPLRRAVVGVVALKIAGVIILFDPNGADPYHLVKSLFSQGTALILAALLGVIFVRFGRMAIPTTRIHLFVLAFAAANVLSALSAESSYIALFGERQSYLGLTFLADMLTLYVAVAVCFRRATDWGIVAISVGVAGLVALIVGSFGDAETLGRFLTMVFGGALGIAISPLGSRARVLRISASCVALVTLVLAVALATRGAIVGFAGALVVAPLVAAKLRGLDRVAADRLLVRGLVAIAIVTGVVAVSPLAARIRGAAQSIDVADRALIYDSGLAAVAARPILGYGPDNFAVAYPKLRQPGSTLILGEVPPTAAPSWPLQTAATLGVVGLFALFMLLGATTRSRWVNGLARAPAIAAPVLVASVGYWFHGFVAGGAVAVDWWPWVAFGTAAVMDGQPAAVVPARRRLPALAAAVPVGLALLGALTGVAALRADEAAHSAKVAWEHGRADVALQAAATSVREDPGRADHWNGLGLAEELGGNYRAASDAFAEAASRAPSSEYWSNLARSRARQLLSGDMSAGGADGAIDAARRAVAADPNAPGPYAVLADVASLSGAYDVALDAAGRAMRLRPGYAEYEDLAVAAALSLTDARAGLNALDALLLIHESATLRVGLAKLSLQLDDRDRARREAGRALELDPQNSDAKAILSQTGG
jgi:tetratricopeptide (TPR) repeat protein/O-antigen ligase